MARTLTVGELKEYLEELVETLEEFNEDTEVRTVSNTYFINSDCFLAYGRQGFIDLGTLEDDLEEAENEKDEDDDDDESGDEE